MCNIAWSKILIAKVHLPLLDYFKNELHHIADVLPIADSACPIIIDTPTIRLRNIDNIEIVKTMLCKATTAILYSSLIAKGYNSLADDMRRIPGCQSFAMGQAHQDATSIQALVRFVQEFLFKVSVTHTTLLLIIHYILSTLPH